MSLFKKIFLPFVLFIAYEACAEVRLPKILSDNMVLQREKPITIWGWANAGEKITVQFNKQSKSTKTDKSGKWIVSLAPEAAGGPFTLTVKGTNTIVLSNILVGEVWICSGQSNMEWPVRSVTNAVNEIQNANFPEIRHFTVQKSISTQLEDDVKGGDWKVCSPQTVGDFTACGLFLCARSVPKNKSTHWVGAYLVGRNAFRNMDKPDSIRTK